MMKTLADLLGAYRQRIDDFHGTSAYRHEAVTVSQMLANDVVLFTAPDGRIRMAVDDVVTAARKFAGGRSITAVAMRAPAEDERLFRALVESLESLRDVLRTAKAPSEAQLLGQALDTRQVPDPF